MKLSTIIPSVFLTGIFFLIPESAGAQTGLANVCNGPDCSACHFVDLANRLITWLIGLVTVLFAVLMVVAGFGLVTAGGNPSALESAKSKFTNAIIGFMIVLAAWLLVDTLMRGLIGGNGDIAGWGPWAQVQCFEQNQDLADLPEPSTLGAPNDFSGRSGTGVDEAGFPSCEQGDPGFPDCGASAVPVTGTLVTYNGRQFDSGSVVRIRALHEAVPGLRLSGGYRTPERNAQVNGSPTSYHIYGRAADFVGTEAEMQAGADWARANGAVEVLIHNAGSGRHLHVAF